MIQLNVDFAVLNKFFGISPQKLHSDYANKDIEEIMALEAAEGNKKAKNYEEILSDPAKILEIFKLASVENKYVILKNMSEGDLDNLLPYLNSEQLTLGLNFFTDEKIIEMTKELPIEELVALIFSEFTLFDVMDRMEDSAMDAFLGETDVKRDYAQNYFESLDVSQLRNIMAQTTGVNYDDKNKKDITDELEGLQNVKFQTFITSMNKENTMNLIAGVVSQDEDLLLLFRPTDLVKPMELLTKDNKLKMLQNLDEEFLIPMVQELPVDLTQIVLTQIDSEDFAEVLAFDFQNILKSVVLFSSK